MRVLIFSADIGEGHDLPARVLRDAHPGAPARRGGDDPRRARRRGARGPGARAPRVRAHPGPPAPAVRRAVLAGRALPADAARSADAPGRPARRPAGAAVAAHGARTWSSRPIPGTTEGSPPPARAAASRVPVVSAITDLAALRYWAHPGCDLHLVIHPESAAEIRRSPAPTTRDRARARAHVTGFERPADGRGARAALGLPRRARWSSVSGGGWGVGDLRGRGRGRARRRRRRARRGAVRAQRGVRAAPRARPSPAAAGPTCTGFTDRMGDVLAAADVLVHSTAGLTVLEALVRGARVDLLRLGRRPHPRSTTAPTARFGLADVAADRRALGRHPARARRAAAARRRLRRPAGRPARTSRSAAAVARRRGWPVMMPGGAARARRISPTSAASRSASTRATARGCTRCGTRCSTPSSGRRGRSPGGSRRRGRSATGSARWPPGAGRAPRSPRSTTPGWPRRRRAVPVEHVHGHAAGGAAPGRARRLRRLRARRPVPVARGLERAIARHRPRAACVVHIGGHLAFRIEEIAALCRAEGVFLLEDCAHAHGATFAGRRPGHVGRRRRLLVLRHQDGGDGRGRHARLAPTPDLLEHARAVPQLRQARPRGAGPELPHERVHGRARARAGRAPGRDRRAGRTTSRAGSSTRSIPGRLRAARRHGLRALQVHRLRPDRAIDGARCTTSPATASSATPSTCPTATGSPRTTGACRCTTGPTAARCPRGTVRATARAQARPAPARAASSARQRRHGGAPGARRAVVVGVVEQQHVARAGGRASTSRATPAGVARGAPVAAPARPQQRRPAARARTARSAGRAVDRRRARGAGRRPRGADRLRGPVEVVARAPRGGRRSRCGGGRRGPRPHARRRRSRASSAPVRAHLLADHEERRARAVLAQQLQHGRRALRMRPVVEGERDGAGQRHPPRDAQRGAHAGGATGPSAGAHQAAPSAAEHAAPARIARAPDGPGKTGGERPRPRTVARLRDPAARE